jgi:DNA-binding transcriptional regulator GbsR (MarR family)
MDEDNEPEAPADRNEPSDLGPHHQKALDRFVLFWGEMASTWGINRTMAQIHALLFAVDEPMDTDGIMERLDISRGNANMNLRSLIRWNLVQKVHVPGSRKDYFTAEHDVWEVTARIIQERERRELRPVVQQLRECRLILTDGEARPCDALADAEQRFCERLENLMHLMKVLDGVSRALLPLLQSRNAPFIRQLIQLAETLHNQDDEPPNPTPPA